MTNIPTTAFIAFGGNLGDPIETLRHALPMLAERVGKIDRMSSLYETKALTLNGEVHPNYVNAVVEISSSLNPESILHEMLQIERELGRDRSPDKRWEPRTIDLDLIFVGDLVMRTGLLNLPHPEVAKRDFVVQPLAEIAPDFLHPVLGKSMRQLNAELAASGVESFVLRTFPFEQRVAAN